ncbi:MAG: ABC-type transport system, involved in lipoprotein release, permease component [Clostridiaceae bacterium]|jgi:putative ABC transport system permease protein|nr:ABC-type transport system, involved in lipoprotein release, permease component [Clostridiaceae bacterium]
MKKTFIKNLFRDIKKTLSRFLSIVIIIAVGVSFYAGVRATSPDMKMSGDYYFNKSSLMDFKLISTLGLTKDDLAKVEELNDVTKAEGSYSIDAVVEKDKRSLVLNVNSLSGDSGINMINMMKGRLPQNNNEAVVEDRFLKENNFKIGDKLILNSGNDTSIGDRLNNSEFKIVGACESPLYVSAQRQLSSVGNGSVRGFVYILPGIFKSDVYTEIYVKTNNKESITSLLDNESYSKTIKSTEDALKDLGISRSKIRYDDVIKTSSEKISQAQDKLSTSKTQAETKFAEAHRQIDNANDEISRNMEKLLQNQDTFNKSMSQGEKQIAQGKSGIQAGENELNLKTKDIEDAKLQITEGKNNISVSENKLNIGKQQAAEGIASAVGEKVLEAKKQLDLDPNNAAYIYQYNLINNIYQKDILGKNFDTIYDSLKMDGALNQVNSYFDLETLKSNFDKAENDINIGKQKIAENEKSIEAGEEKLAAGRKELEANKNTIANAEIQLNSARSEGLNKLSQGKFKLSAAENVVAENAEKLSSEEEKANSEFKKAEAEIEQNRNKLKDIKNAKWYVLGRSANVGYETYRQDSDRIDNIGKAFPMIFFLVAALVSLTTMTRMVQENRTEIGTFKALGYSRGSIVCHYLFYSLAASVIGSIIGVSFGYRLFPPLIMNAYSSLYTIPTSVTPFNGNVALQASVIAIFFTASAAAAATMEELREVPASLMRPKPPKSGKTILLEKIAFIWKRLSFTSKVTARNIFRYKQRFFMTVFGIAACTGLMITGFGLKSGIIGAVESQFNKIYIYDMQTALKNDINVSEKDDMKSKIMKDTNIKSVLFAYSKNGSIKKDSSGTEDAYVVVPENENDINKYIDLTMKGKSLQLSDEGVIISEKLSKLINKKIGDTIDLTINDKAVKAKISDITEQYVQHYIYMSPAYYEKITGEKILFNGFYGLLNSVSDSSENNTSKALTSVDGVNSISFKNRNHIDYNKSINSINSVVLVLIASAGVLAFVVIYNLTNININERKRELATIKLLGFYNNELASYIYRENVILTIIGSLVGIVVGIVLDNFVIITAETNVMMFLRTIKPIYFLYSVVLTILFSVIVNLVMYGRFDKIDMIESLKNAE